MTTTVCPYCQNTGGIVIRNGVTLARSDWNGDDGEIDWCDCAKGRELRQSEDEKTLGEWAGLKEDSV